RRNRADPDPRPVPGGAGGPGTLDPLNIDRPAPGGPGRIGRGPIARIGRRPAADLVSGFVARRPPSCWGATAVALFRRDPGPAPPPRPRPLRCRRDQASPPARLPRLPDPRRGDRHAPRRRLRRNLCDRLPHLATIAESSRRRGFEPART